MLFFKIYEKLEDLFMFLFLSESKIDPAIIIGYGNMYDFEIDLGFNYDSVGYIYVFKKKKILNVFTKRKKVLKKKGRCLWIK